ncbi:MAG TPA: ABC transporter permease, partial [Pyrinomonadaceae bacterium]|nr:ABC transporter permease [Pyrinomonadaceae bacterium]
MKKFLAVVKREYIQRVRAKMFIVSTILLPLVMSLFGIVPALILSIDTGSPMRVAIVDQTGKIYDQLNVAMFNEAGQQDTTNQPRGRGFGNFVLEKVEASGQSAEQIRAELDRRLRDKEIDGYMILPPDFLAHGQAEFFNRNPGDVMSRRMLQSALNRAVREQRLIEAKVDTKTRQGLFQPVDLQAVKIGATGQERDSGGSFALVFGIGFVMYLAILMYGQIILGAVIEEKETRIAEILFSSVKPFALMMGKLVGVSFVALTQLAIWG